MGDDLNEEDEARGHGGAVVLAGTSAAPSAAAMVAEVDLVE